MTTRQKRSPITIEDATIRFRNFSGKPGKYNPPGRRNFVVLLDNKTARALAQDNWNIRWLDPKEEGDDPQAYLSVEVRFDVPENTNIQPPRIVLISKRGKTILNEDEVNILDWAEIEKVDLTINPRVWEKDGQPKVKAYLKSIFITIIEDELDAKYYDIPDSAAGAIGGCGNCEACDGSCHHDKD